MDVLFASPVLPWPLDSGGRIRTYHLARNAARECRVHLRCVLADGQDRADVRHLAPWCASVELFERSEPGPLRTLARAKIERWFHSTALHARLREECASGRYALLHVDELLLARAVDARPAIPVVQHHHKLDADLFASTTGGRGPQRHFDLWKLRRLERASLARTRQHVFCSADDRASFEQRNGPTQAAIVANGYDPEHFGAPRAERATREPERLLFVGSLSYEPNVNACARFVDDVLPRLVARRPRLVLDIVGRAPAPAVRALAGPNVAIHADVPDVVPFLERCAVFVVPLRIGGGTRLKIPEALALAAPVVSTSIGAQGLDLVHGEHLLLADTGAALGDAIESLLADPARAAALGAAGRAHVERHYAWPQLAQQLVAFWRATAAAAPR
ncbi:MAG: glycosyltransferase [Planctomycetota bacterium]|nr:MAG: glycosyltransferase [Planctomycetota bacterium]